MLEKHSLNEVNITYICPVLEYANITWDSCSVENKRSLEKRYRWKRLESRPDLPNCSIQSLYNKTGWDTLQSRRNKRKLCQLYKIINGLTPQSLQNIFPPRVYELTRYRLFNYEYFPIPVSRPAAYYSSLIYINCKRLQRRRARRAKLSNT